MWAMFLMFEIGYIVAAGHFMFLLYKKEIMEFFSKIGKFLKKKLDKPGNFLYNIIRKKGKPSPQKEGK